MNLKETTDSKCVHLEENNMKIGDYIVIQRKTYSKLHKISNKLSVMLGNNQLDLQNIVGRRFSKTFKMVPVENKRNVFVLEECSKAESLAEKLLKDVASGTDNRNIVTDSNSQKLSKEEIVGLRDSGMSGCDIVGQLLENSKTFQEKTEYSQKKYLSKKEKKYFDYVLIRKPSLRLVSEIIYKQDPMKIMGLRCDTLSQLVTGVGICSGGTYLIYESSCEGLPTAALLNYLGETGHLVHTFPGLTPQKQAILAMNFSESQKRQLISVSFQSLIQKLCNKVVFSKETVPQLNKENFSISVVNGEEANNFALTCDEIKQSSTHQNTESEDRSYEFQISSAAPIEQVVQVETDEFDKILSEQLLLDEKEKNLSDAGDSTTVTTSFVTLGCENTKKEELGQERKRKFVSSEAYDVKKPRWEMELDRAADLLSARNIDGLVVVGREDPGDIVLTLLPYVAPSRNFVVYGWCREPLIELYLKLKKEGNVVNAHLTETFFRTHQVLPKRTHPDIQMSGSGGYLLIGTVVLPHQPLE